MPSGSKIKFQKKDIIIGILSGAGAVYISEIAFWLIYFLADDIIHSIIVNNADSANILKLQLRTFLMLDFVFVLAAGYIFSRKLKIGKSFGKWFIVSFAAVFLIEAFLRFGNMGL